MLVELLSIVFISDSLRLFFEGLNTAKKSDIPNSMVYSSHAGLLVFQNPACLALLSIGFIGIGAAQKLKKHQPHF
jgi:hypothetical protein